MLNYCANGPSGYNLTNSLRFRSSASAYLNRTPSSAGNRQIMTYSFWVKRGAITGDYNLTNATTDASNSATLYFNSSNNQTFDVFLRVGATNYSLTTSQVFRDPSAWYHIVVAIDTTQATSSNRTKVYVNGSQVTNFLTANYVPQNSNLALNNNVAQYIGYSNYFDGYMAEVNFIDGQALTPSSFGSTNSTTGVWQPAKYTGTYGTNGFYLPFSPSSTSSYAGSFNGSNQYLSLPNSSAWDLSTGNWTIETWFKFSSISTNGNYIAGNTDAYYGSGGWGVLITSSYQIYLNGNGNSQGIYAIGSSALSANQWHHLAVVRSGTGANSVSLYLDGVPYTATGNGAGNPTFASSSTGINIGYGNYASSYFNGNISNLRVVKGYAQYPINASGITVPSAPLTAVTGTSLLTLQNATIIDNSTNAFTITNNNTVTSATASPFVANIFGDKSGNNNDWAGNNINYTTAGTTYDSMTDVPTLTSATVANYAVLNPIANSSGTFSNANLSASVNGFDGNAQQVKSTFQIPTSGKWYFEITPTTLGAIGIGLHNDDAFSTSRTAVQTANGYGLVNGAIFSSGGTTYTTGDIIGVAVNVSASTVYIYKNNTLINTLTGIANISTAYGGFSQISSSGSCAADANFGQRPFAYTPPTGYVALNTYNLPTPTILQGNKYMDATAYTGTNGSPTTQVISSNFQPDFLWFKKRNAAYDHALIDTNRGITKQLYSNLTNTEGTDSDVLTAIGALSFTVGNSNYSNYGTLVAWTWKANGGTTSSNTQGSITSTVQANTTAGFSVVTWSGNSTSGATIGHGLGVAPKMFIVKNRTNAEGWVVGHTSIGWSNFLQINNTNASASSAFPWNNTAPSSTLITLGSGTGTNGSGYTYVGYAWAEIAGFSKFTSYVGNGSTGSDQPFVYLGFRPKFVLIKKSSSDGNVTSWSMVDTSRNPYNLATNLLFANLSDAEQSADNTQYDILSNGIKIRSNNSGFGINQNGSTYIVAAWAENPFKNSLAR